MRLLLNGRFLGRPVTGVDRVAIEISRALGDLIKQLDGAVDLEVILPSGGEGRMTPLDDGMSAPGHAIFVPGRGHAWEQGALLCYRPKHWLLNLCNTGPILRRRQIVMIHDAQFITQPQSYSLAFKAWYRVMLTVLGRSARLVFTPSQSSQTLLEAHYVVPSGKARIMRLGVDHMARINADPRIIDRLDLRGKRYILAIGSLAPHKNLPRLVRAFTEAELDDVRLVIAGGGNPIVFRDAGLPAAEKVDYIGRVSDPELKALYAHAEAFAFPSISEGFGLPPIEAMWTGCPVIASTGGSIPEVCGDAALYADPLDVGAWTAAMRRLINDPDLRVAMAAKSRHHAATFTWSSAARQLLNALAVADKNDELVAALANLPTG